MNDLPPLALGNCTSTATAPNPVTATKTAWSDEWDQLLLELLLIDGKSKGRLGAKWTCTVGFYAYLIHQFPKSLATTSRDITARIRTLRSNYLDLRDFLRAEHFLLDPETHTVLARNDQWDDYVGSTIRRFRAVPFPLYYLEELVFEEESTALVAADSDLGRRIDFITQRFSKENEWWSETLCEEFLRTTFAREDELQDNVELGLIEGELDKTAGTIGKEEMEKPPPENHTIEREKEPAAIPRKEAVLTSSSSPSAPTIPLPVADGPVSISTEREREAAAAYLTSCAANAAALYSSASRTGTVPAHMVDGSKLPPASSAFARPIDPSQRLAKKQKTGLQPPASASPQSAAVGGPVARRDSREFLIPTIEDFPITDAALKFYTRARGLKSGFSLLRNEYLTLDRAMFERLLMLEENYILANPDSGIIPFRNTSEYLARVELRGQE